MRTSTLLSSGSGKYFLHPFRLAEGYVSHVGCEYEVVPFRSWQRPAESFRVNVGLEVVALQAVLFLPFHLSFEGRGAVDAAM